MAWSQDALDELLKRRKRRKKNVDESDEEEETQRKYSNEAIERRFKDQMSKFRNKTRYS